MKYYFSILQGLALLTLVTGLGCGKRQVVVYNQPELPQAGYYETAWVDPNIVISDSLYTLITSQRVDSFYVDKPDGLLKPTGSSLVFSIPAGGCFAYVNLLDDRSSLIRPLIALELPGGHYKLTLNSSRLDRGLSATGTYYLRAVYCGFAVTERIVRQ